MNQLKILTIFLLFFVQYSTSSNFQGLQLYTKRNAGDLIYQNCQNMTISGFKLNDACVSLVSDGHCGIITTLKVGQEVLMSEELDLSISPQVCGMYNKNGIQCQICVSIPLKDNVTRCVSVSPKCANVNIQAGCFPDSLIDDQISCANTCPNNCSNYGNCVNGVCKCDSSHYGEDCSSTGEMFYYCAKVDEVSASLCGQVLYEDCTLEVKMLLSGAGTEKMIYDDSFSMDQFTTLFQEGQCVSTGLCTACLSWDNLHYTNESASACGSINITCPGMDPYLQKMGCFQDNTVIPQCFDYNINCPNKCSGHGTCVDNEYCQCDDNFSGEDCSTEKLGGKISKSRIGAFALTGIAGLFSVVGGVIIYFVYKKMRQVPTTAKFARLDLDDEEELIE